ncbi:MAG: zf-HC2 domain-containing protein [Acidobacteria bacterium]|nr:zf-HC2 domain-containing protein [Acidobacteriota bacterium]
MARCSDIDPLTTPFVDGESSPSERMRVAGHIEDCPECHRHVAAEQTARAVVRARAEHLVQPAPAGLRSRCTATSRHRVPRPARARSFPLLSRAGWPIALAATMLLAVFGTVAYGVLVHPAEALAAQLTLDHLKCFALFGTTTGQTPAEVQRALKDRFGFDVSLPEERQAGGLTLVGGRRCLSLDGAVAHVLYRRGSLPVSLFVLPPGAKLSHTELEWLGHTSVAFTRAGRTWVVVARASHVDLERLASVFDPRAQE